MKRKDIISRRIVYWIKSGVIIATPDGVVSKFPCKPMKGYVHKGYRCVKIESENVRVDQLVWISAYGPYNKSSHMIAYKNGDRLDTRLCNLELVSRNGNVSRREQRRKGTGRSIVIKMIESGELTVDTMTGSVCRRGKPVYGFSNSSGQGYAYHRYQFYTNGLVVTIHRSTLLKIASQVNAANQ